MKARRPLPASRCCERKSFEASSPSSVLHLKLTLTTGRKSDRRRFDFLPVVKVSLRCNTDEGEEASNDLRSQHRDAGNGRRAFIRGASLAGSNDAQAAYRRPLP